MIAATRERGRGPRRGVRCTCRVCRVGPRVHGPCGQAVSHLGLGRLKNASPWTRPRSTWWACDRPGRLPTRVLTPSPPTRGRRRDARGEARRRCVARRGGPFPGTSPPPSSSPPPGRRRGGARVRRGFRGDTRGTVADARGRPGGPLAAEAGVPPGRTYDDDDGDVGAGDEDGDGDELSGAEPRRHPWRPLVTHVRVPRLRRTRWWRHNPSSSTATGPAFPRRTEERRLRAQTRRRRSGTGTRGGVAGANESARGVAAVRALHRPGRFCCAHVAVPSGKVDEVSVGWAVSALSSALTRAGLTWAHAGTARGSSSGGAIGRDGGDGGPGVGGGGEGGRRRGWNVGVRARARPGGERVWGGGRGARPGTVGRDGVGRL